MTTTNSLLILAIAIIHVHVVMLRFKLILSGAPIYLDIYAWLMQ